MFFQLDLYFLYFFFVAYAEIQSLWDNAGCTSDGLLSPTHVPYFWRTVKNQREFIQNLQSKIDRGDAMATLSCFGQVRSEHSNSYTNQFHLVWECQDSSTCILPPTHALCVRTLRKLHPDATIKLWSSSLDENSLSQMLQDLNIQLTRYDISYFDDLPPAAQEAAADIQQRMHSKKADHARENSFSHWSDLFRAAVLYKEGGVYTDLDSIWLRPISQVSENEEWIPKTPALTEIEHENDAVNIEDKRYFLEGGVMRFDKPQSPFLKSVLETFPKYDEEMAQCWACVGPRQLTRTYNGMDESQPALIDSAKIFGVRNYRNYFANMFREFDPVIWSEILDSDEVAAHLFTASSQTGIAKDSTIYHLLRVGGVTSAATDNSASWRHAEKERRNLLSSLYYLEYGSAVIASTDSVVFNLEMSGVNDNNFDAKETAILTAVAAALSTSIGNLQLAARGSLVRATVFTENTKEVSESVADESFVSAVNEFMEDNTVQALAVSSPETGTHDAVIGDGSVIYWYGNGESVSASVTVTDTVDMPAYKTEIRSIFMGAFEVPLSAVMAQQSSDNQFTVKVSGVITAYASENLAEVSDAIADSTVLPNGSGLVDIDIAEPGYTEATVIVSKPIVSHADNLDALLISYMIAQESFNLEEDATPETQLVYTVSGDIACAVRASWTIDEITSAYERKIGDMLETEISAESDESGSGTFSLSSPTFLDASNNVTKIEDKPQPFEIPQVSEECYWSSNGIVVSITTIIQKAGQTHTQMAALSDAAQARYEQDGFTFISSTINSYGQQDIGACEMLAECQADYTELYEMLAGAHVVKTSRSETDALSWWWDFQIGRYITMRGHVISMDNVRQKDGFFWYQVADDTLINTCVQHSASWADPCDSSVGVCAGSANYGFSSQQATALTEALEQTSNIHRDCPADGCLALDQDWMDEIMQVAPSISPDVIESLCILENKYYLWIDPLTIVDTCVGYSDTADSLCPLSDYTFCSDIDYNTGSVVYGNVTYQGYSLQNALGNENYRHPQCL